MHLTLVRLVKLIVFGDQSYRAYKQDKFEWCWWSADIRSPLKPQPAAFVTAFNACVDGAQTCFDFTRTCRTWDLLAANKHTCLLEVERCAQCVIFWNGKTKQNGKWKYSPAFIWRVDNTCASCSHISTKLNLWTLESSFRLNIIFFLKTRHKLTIYTSLKLELKS